MLIFFDLLWVYTGNLYYKQAVYNYKLASLSAKVVEAGPIYCPVDGNNCTSYRDLIKTCEEDQQSTAAQDSVISIIKIASSVFVKPDPGKVLDSASQLFSAVNVLVASSSILIS
jgi:hypothetical protein